MTRKEAGISLRQMLFDGFNVSSNVARTDAEANAQRLAMISEAENTALRVAEVYLNMLRQQEILELSKQNLETHEQIAATSASGPTRAWARLRTRPRLMVVLPVPMPTRLPPRTTIAMPRANSFALSTRCPRIRYNRFPMDSSFQPVWMPR